MGLTGYLKLLVYFVVSVGGGWLTVTFFLRMRATDKDTFKIALAAFLGAFFSFLFVRLATWLDRLWDRHSDNRARLLFHELRLNETLDALHDNVTLAEEFQKTIKKPFSASDPTQGVVELGVPMPAAFPTALPVDRDVFEGLTNIDLVNDLFLFQRRLEGLNSLIDSTNNSYKKSVEAVLEKVTPGRPPGRVFFLNRFQVISDLSKLLGLGRDLIQECLGLLAKVRVLAADHNNPAVWIIKKMTRRSYPRNMDKRVAKETKQLELEVEEVKRAAHERIERVLHQAEDDPSA